MTALLQQVKGNLYPHSIDYLQKSNHQQRDKPHVDFYETRVELKTYPDLSLLDLIDADKHKKSKRISEKAQKIGYHNRHGHEWSMPTMRKMKYFALVSLESHQTIFQYWIFNFLLMLNLSKLNAQNFS